MLAIGAVICELLLNEDSKNDTNPRGLPRFKDGRGKGRGISGGRRLNKNTEECPDGGPGYGQGEGRGQGRNR